jgi:4-hydroxy-tetrahydrodipicolinate reductase
MTTHVILAGATGWAGSALARGVAAAPDLALVAAVARKAAGRALGDALGDPSPSLGAPVFARATDAIAHAKADVFVEYTLPDTARANVLAALEAGLHVVIGTSGLGDDDFAVIDARAREGGRAVLACGNFALTAVLLQRFAEEAAKWIASFEVIDYGKLHKPDAPSGTARELAARLAAVRSPDIGVALDAISGPREARGASVAGVQVHSMRLPGFVSSVEAVFGQDGERLHLRHESTGSAAPYVSGALLAIRRVASLPAGLHRGLDRVMT